MEEPESPVEALFEKAELYVKTTVELYKLKTIHQSVEVVSSLAVSLVLWFGIVFTFMILSISLALWLGECLGKTLYGFFATGCLYSFLLIILYLLRDFLIKKPVSNVLIRMLLPKKSE